MPHLETLTPLLGIVAAERTTARPDLFDDARQEGLIRAWEVEAAKPDAPREYVLAAAKRAIGDVLRGRPMTGEEGRRGWQDAADYAGPLVAADDDEDTLAALADPTAADALDRAEACLHLEEVRAAVLALGVDDLAIVTARFVDEMSWPEAARHLGRKPEAVRRRFVDHIAPRLRADLTHLEELAA